MAANEYRSLRMVTAFRWVISIVSVLVVMGLTGCNSSVAQTQGRPRSSTRTTSAPSPTTPTVPSGGTSDQVSMNSVSCVPSGQCVTVGSSLITTGSISESSLTLNRLGNDSRWSVGAKGQPPITSVSCVAPNTCLAIGNQGTTTQGFGEWNGQSWTSLAAPPTALIDGDPTSAPQVLSCTSPQLLCSRWQLHR